MRPVDRHEAERDGRLTQELPRSALFIQSEREVLPGDSAGSDEQLTEPQLLAVRHDRSV
jgi:hypothetical protein